MGRDRFVMAVRESLRRRGLLRPRDEVLVALSGGPDSTALLAALVDLQRAGALGGLAALHVDHGLRPGSDADGRACAALCRRLGVDFRSVRVSVAPGNVQAQARSARYRALRDEAARRGAAHIATGHTLDDQAETVLLRLLRGAGARGLAGIPPRRGPFVRPLIDRTRAEVIRFLERRGLPWLEDPSNATPRYLRNRLRHQVMPALREIAPHADRALARAADLLRDDERALARRAALHVQGARVRVDEIRAEPLAVRRRAVRRLWKQATGSARGLTASHVEKVVGLIRKGRGGPVALPAGLEARLAGGQIEVGGAEPSGRPAACLAPVAIPAPGRHPLPDGRYLHLELDGPISDVAWPLSLRTRLPGDRFRPARGRGSKKLKAWLIDRKVPQAERDRLLLLADAAGNVLWIPALGALAAVPGLRVRLARG